MLETMLYCEPGAAQLCQGRTESEACWSVWRERGAIFADEEMRCIGESSCQVLHELRFKMFLGVNGRLKGPLVCLDREVLYRRQYGAGRDGLWRQVVGGVSR